MRSRTKGSLQGSYHLFGGSILMFLQWEEHIAAANLDCMVVAMRFGASKREHSTTHLNSSLLLSSIRHFYLRAFCWSSSLIDSSLKNFYSR
jgi:hypothetical protein